MSYEYFIAKRGCCWGSPRMQYDSLSDLTLIVIGEKWKFTQINKLEKLFRENPQQQKHLQTHIRISFRCEARKKTFQINFQFSHPQKSS
jgi:hypothetical protein